MPETEAPEVAEPSDKQTTGEVDPSKWEEAQAVTGRPNDTPIDDPQPSPIGDGNSTFGARAEARSKAVGKAENKQVGDAESKDEDKPKRATRKKAS